MPGHFGGAQFHFQIQAVNFGSGGPGTIWCSRSLIFKAFESGAGCFDDACVSILNREVMTAA